MDNKIKRALISVSNKEGIVDFAKKLDAEGVEILSTGGTAKALKENGVRVRDVSEYTGFPELMDGRVKTLHPKIHGGILGLRENPKHVKQAADNGIEFIDLVAVNLYPFSKIVRADNPNVEEAIENIDIGGPSMIRSAAKNYKNVVVIVSEEDYPLVLSEIEKTGGVSLETRQRLATAAFNHTAKYDILISNFFREQFDGVLFPPNLNLYFKKLQDLRYGENPHQKAAFYREFKVKEDCVTNSKQLAGKELSYNNIIDADAGYEIVKDFESPCAAVVKHNNPSGVAVREKISDAFKAAFDADSLSAFGCVIALNRECDLKTAELIAPNFVELVIAPGFSADAIELLSKKKNVRLLQTNGVEKNSALFDMKKVRGGLLVQTYDFPSVKKTDLKIVTKKAPTDAQLNDLLFAFKVCRHVKSNTIVFAKDNTTV